MHLCAIARITLIPFAALFSARARAMKQAASFNHAGSGGRGDLREAQHEVNRIATALKVDHDARKRAADLYVDARAAPFGRGIPHAVLAASTLYVACRENKTPVTLRDLADASGSDQRDVGKCYLQLLDNMHITRPKLNGRKYVSHLSLKRPVSEQARELSQEIIKSMSERGLGGRNPMTLAAAALYLACCSMGENITQSEVAEAAGVGEESVRECCKAIRMLTKESPA